MLKFYVITSLIATILTILAQLRKLSKNVREYRNNHGTKAKWFEKVVSYIQLLLYCWIPLVNIIYSFVSIYLLLVSEYTLIKILDKYKKDEVIKKKEIEHIIKN